ncbi:DUF3862 domain-containing protein [Loigolactobacillus backii]|uniref:Uncharacterized protein n=1 Tax=Loigolactobacillus backii TaxID=375175 RepID=A0A192GZB2_9LACO|nr:DUF3862 domain-containing protein [Loigolactobacillus backii]ANK58957.1 hypothetical protein AYR52_00935 [Loigolactobacillus backii]ANK61373.1 hypothetical protein AYR53_00550 [Loigolactobacillus backii]ANK63945.1 hypothetical protein AYR54_00920 [Loigolactobacillus backii]ANK66393.1 hypothetical protein AYR55_00925 [Loigolactobacillus backii]ANK69427.1 hypothetical protein AYR56_04165 [Loigolactobacillus backii]
MWKKSKRKNEIVYVEKKPVYKQRWFWILIVIVILLVAGDINNFISKNNSTSTDRTAAASSAPTPKKNTHAKVNLVNDITANSYNNIKVGNLTKSGGDGTTYISLVQKFGKPSTTSDAASNNIATKVKTWSNISGSGPDAKMTVSFVHNHAVDKNLTGIQVTRENNISLDQFNSVQNGQSYQQVTKELGKPNAVRVTSNNGKKTTVTEYLTGVAGKQGANIIIIYDNAKVTGKTQNNMK